MRFLIVTLFFISFSLQAQKSELLPISLRNSLKTMDPSRSVDLFLRGDALAISEFVRNREGLIKSVSGSIVSCRIKASDIPSLNEVYGLEFIEYSNSKPQVLNDVMITHNNINPIHDGVLPLERAYFGENVVVGIIDTGIELAHPDFQNEDGSTRVVALWDQTQSEDIPFRVPEPYGYGQEWNAEDIDLEISGHIDQPNQYGHGSTVAGVCAGNGNASGAFKGVAPKADMVVVSSDLNLENWNASVVDAISYIFEKADDLGKPAVVNLSLGDYYGSHDGLDAATLMIEEMLDETPGRCLVAAAGNSGNQGNYHLSYDIPEADTAFTWFSYNPSAMDGAVYFELWADTADFSNTEFAIGAELTVPDFEMRGYSLWRNAALNLGQNIVDTIFYQNEILGIVETWMGLRGGQYLVQVKVTEPFSNQYLWRFSTTGGGIFDCWSHAPYGTSAIIDSNLPDPNVYPDMWHYQLPDNSKTIVDAWACSDKVITVGNFHNRDSFINYLQEETTYEEVPGTISINCSRGPTRDNRQKPTISATGDHTLSAGKISVLNSWVTLSPQKVSADGWHYINGGTSLAAPVVAGVAALYLEREPTATYADIQDAMIATAVADIHTGILPGNQFGHGKLNGFETVLQAEPDEPDGVLSNSELHFSIYPNPTSEVLMVDMGGLKIQALAIFDLAGRKLNEIKLNQSSPQVFELNVSNLASGVYLIKANFGAQGYSTGKLIIEN